MAKQLVCFRIERTILRDLREQAKAMNMPVSQAIRFLVFISYKLLFPPIRIQKDELIKQIQALPGDKIPLWKVASILTNLSDEEIEKYVKRTSTHDFR